MKKRFFTLFSLISSIAIGLTGLAKSSQTKSPHLEAADSELGSWWDGDGMASDLFGLRPALSEHGLDLSASYTVDLFGNTMGGLKRGTVYAGVLQFGADLDLEKALGWQGASVSTSWLWLTGRDASADLAGNFLTISNIAGYPTLRLSELWFQQNAWDDAFSIRVGQLAADSEFIISDYAALFINGTFGWPGFTSMNIPNGGPAYPMGTLGVRVAVQPVPWFSLLMGGFQGNVFDQTVNRHGFRYRLDASTGYTFLAESQFRWNHAEDEQGLPGQLKGGAWFQTGDSADALGGSSRRRNFGVYAVLDQMLFREPARSSDGQSDQGLGFFTRISLAPQNRNVVDFYLDTGLTYQGLIPGRDEDALGVAFAYAKISDGAKTGLSNDGFQPAGGEMVLETTYQIQVNPWLSVQPDLQYIIQPNATRDINNAFLIGLRANFVF